MTNSQELSKQGEGRYLAVFLHHSERVQHAAAAIVYETREKAEAFISHNEARVAHEDAETKIGRYARKGRASYFWSTIVDISCDCGSRHAECRVER